MRESHFFVAQWRTNAGVVFQEQPILRILFMLPCELANQALEVIAYDVSHYSMAEWLDDCVPAGLVKSRQAEVSFGPVNIKSACVGYRWVDNIAAERNPFFTQEGYFDEQGRIIEPYNIDWPREMDATPAPVSE